MMLSPTLNKSNSHAVFFFRASLAPPKTSNLFSSSHPFYISTSSITFPTSSLSSNQVRLASYQGCCYSSPQISSPQISSRHSPMASMTTTFKILIVLALLAVSSYGQAPGASPTASPPAVVTAPTPSSSAATPSPTPSSVETPSDTPASSPSPTPSLTSPTSSSPAPAAKTPTGEPADNSCNGWSGVVVAGTALFGSLVAASFY